MALDTLPTEAVHIVTKAEHVARALKDQTPNAK